ncbi:CBN-HSR-9 protein [Aphelenchoides avenae]|nr:CBN-HSR-9 protein [Aphelenchus avenae]
MALSSLSEPRSENHLAVSDIKPVCTQSSDYSSPMRGEAVRSRGTTPASAKEEVARTSAASTVPNLSDDEQLKADLKCRDSREAPIGARVFARYRTGYYPAVVCNIDAYECYNVFFMDDRFHQTVPNDGLFPLARFEPGMKAMVSPDLERASIGREIELLEGPSTKDASEWTGGVYKVRDVHNAEELEVVWTQFYLRKTDAVAYKRVRMEGASSKEPLTSKMPGPQDTKRSAEKPKQETSTSSDALSTADENASSRATSSATGSDTTRATVSPSMPSSAVASRSALTAPRRVFVRSDDVDFGPAEPADDDSSSITYKSYFYLKPMSDERHVFTFELQQEHSDGTVTCRYYQCKDCERMLTTEKYRDSAVRSILCVNGRIKKRDPDDGHICMEQEKPSVINLSP